MGCTEMNGQRVVESGHVVDGMRVGYVKTTCLRPDIG